LALAPTPAGASPTPAQQRCIAGTGTLGARVAKAQNRWGLACARASGRAPTPAAADTAACMSHDATGRVARRVRALEARAGALCGGGRGPDFGWADPATVATAARAASLDLTTALFGAAPERAIVRRAVAARAHRCQATVLARTERLLETLWRVALDSTRDVLRGAARQAPPTDTAVASAGALAAEIGRALERDGGGTIAHASTRLGAWTTRACADAEIPLATLFPGECAATEPPALADCAARLARRGLHRALATIHALPLDCDLLDDGTANLSCAAPALQRHVLDRLGYGPDANARARMQTLGVRAYIAEQLAPATIPDAKLDTALAQFPSLALDFHELRARYPIQGNPNQPRVGDVLKEITRAKILRAVASRRQLEQVLVDFWLNHFNVNAADRRLYDIVSYERDVIRPRVLGHFGDLLLAVARSPAMGDFLQNRHSRAGALNENYGRELLEVHTVGIDGGYTEADVTAVARCLTGWREDYFAPEGFRFEPAWHDRDAKTVMGLTLPTGGGEDDGRSLLAYLATHPNTARAVSRKLVVRFVADEPPPRLVDAATAVFLASDGDLRAVLETIVLAPEFLHHAEHRGTKVKRPLQFVASLARALGADADLLNLDGLRTSIRDMGEELYRAAPPMGYTETTADWSSPGGMILRLNEIDRATRRRQGYRFTYPRVDAPPPILVASLVDLIFGADVAAATRTTTLRLLADLPPGGPDTRAEQAAAILLASPEFLHH
jgi:uncharacterized protein (DUF1800 family)